MNHGVISNHVRINIPPAGQLASTLSGRLETFSTKRMHTHAYHQLLTIQNGVSLLEEITRRQPLFGSMAALIPADLPHRSTVVGEPVTYKSLYFAPHLFEAEISEIIIFNMSSLCAALFNRIEIRSASEIDKHLNRQCLDLLLKILREDLLRPVNLARLPQPSHPQIRRVVDFIEQNYYRRLGMSDVVEVFPYSERHISRLFKADMKISVFEYLRLYRILTASVRLSTSPATITEIAYDCGYESISTFYRDFSMTFGLAPGVFRDRVTMLQTLCSTDIS
ncbi:MAG: AraC family transcriptional regulator [Syntrophobacteraceae bacterium]